MKVKKGILIVAFGLGSTNAEQTFHAFCKLAEQEFAPLHLRHAFTSETGRTRLAHKGKKSDSVIKAFEKMIFEKYTHIYVQSLHLIPGIEYHNLIRSAKDIMNKHSVSIRIASPLFYEEKFFNLSVEALKKNLSLLTSSHEAIIYMGHGTKKTREPQADALYLKLAHVLQEKDKRLFLACMKGSITLKELIPQLKEQDIHKVHLFPLLSLIGRHAIDDMAGDDEKSWKSQLEKAGFSCQATCLSLLQADDFISFWIRSLKELIHKYEDI